MEKISDGWLFTKDYEKGFIDAEEVRLPHSVSTLPLHYCDRKDYEMVSGYRKTITINEEDENKRIFIVFDGAAHIATLFINGKYAYTHRSGYTSFRVEITDFIHLGENEITVKLDSTENPSIPPFGNVIDYLTYGGLYRDVWLDKKEDSYIRDAYITTPTLDSLRVDYSIDGRDDLTIISEVIDSRGKIVAEATADKGQLKLSSLSVDSWSPESPVLYTLHSILLDGERVIDERIDTFGFRTISFTENKFLLNGKKYFIRGLNRHQSWPYIGYAAPERMQREDARYLKKELGCNCVRTSHYPQSQYFIDECDRIGLLVFTEIPGWQHIGDQKWKEVAVENTKEMVLQYRNHPSIFLWGVRINESMDDDDFYSETNRVAHTLDPSRPTSGVRFLERSSLLEDVYAFNDFSHTGKNPGVKRKRSVTKEKKPLIVSEANGHMFPTKSFDSWERRQEHALRHARVLNDAMADCEHIGCIEWCMFDYATHRDFGSGDRICYHGVMDSFRNRKDAGYFYASQGDNEEVLHISSSMDIGDYNGGVRGKVWIFTNAEKVKIYKNGKEITVLSNSPFTALPHGPIPFDDTIGNLLETEEGYGKKKAKIIKDCLNAAVEYGFQNLPLKYIVKLGWCMVRYGLKFSDGVALFGKYVQGWGGEATEWRISGVWNGEEKKSVTISPSSNLSLITERNTETLTEGNGYDETLVRIRIVDGNGNLAPYALLPVKVRSEGSIETIGPDTIVAEGGMTGVIVKTNGREGKGRLILEMDNKETILEFNVVRK